jgi:methylthioribose-1-phosphate isomerase
MNAAEQIRTFLALAAAVVTVVAWLIRLEAVAKRAHEKAGEACQAAEKLDREIDTLRPIATHLEVMAARMSNLIERVSDGQLATRERFNTLESKIDHALNNAREARDAAGVLVRRERARKGESL